MKEIFKDIPNYEGLYQISNLGRVKSLKRISFSKRHNKYRTISERMLKQSISGRYKIVALNNCGKLKSFRVHQLVAIKFLNHKPNRCKLVVDHIDNNPLNNNVSNLQIITNRENTSKDRKNGTSKYIGVSWCKRSKKWIAYITINGKNKNLGSYDCELNASIAYNAALIKLNLKNETYL
ncbi:MAG: hypothetical protein GY793_01730 [Proteobacteria bacterium]|nr:hypothetical protein [Pseudomonadota bacterium]